ncbi:Uncharacterised protein [Mycobacteroides abscessus subsp. abscessus]|nr:Uncharacterised protein [Mycobacteroides abscessus subsp. abscessus]
MRTSAPCLPSGRRAASTSKKAWLPTLIISAASRVAVASAGSATNTTSTSLT